MNPQTLLDERAKEFDEKFPAPIFCDWSNHDDDSEKIKAHDQESILKGVRLEREKMINLISRAKSSIPVVPGEPLSRFGHGILDELLKEIAALEAKEKELGV